MKKTILFAVMMCVHIASSADNPRIITTKTDIDNTRGSRFAECMEGSVFSQIFDFDGTTQLGDDTYLEIANQFNASGPFQSVRFWWWDPFAFLADENIFTINVYDGPPNDPGTNLIHTTSANGTISMVEDDPWGDIFRIDLDLNESIDLSFGWIGMSAYIPDENTYHVSFFSHNETGLTPLLGFSNNSWFSSTGSNNLLCLGAAPQPLPLSKHALYISIFMIGLFVILRMKSRMS